MQAEINTKYNFSSEIRYSKNVMLSRNFEPRTVLYKAWDVAQTVLRGKQLNFKIAVEDIVSDPDSGFLTAHSGIVYVT